MHYPCKLTCSTWRFSSPCVSRCSVLFVLATWTPFIINWGSSATFFVLRIVILYTTMFSSVPSLALCWFTSYYHLISAQIIMFPVLQARRAEVSHGMPGWRQRCSLTSSFAGSPAHSPMLCSSCLGAKISLAHLLNVLSYLSSKISPG